MQIILSEDVPKLGRAGEIKNVSDGFARNFLFPKKLALPSSPANVKRLETELKKRELRRAYDLESAKRLQEQLEKISLVFYVRAGKEGHLFGSVSSQMIAEALQAQGVTLNKKNILLPSSIKSLGKYEVVVKLHSEINTKVQIQVLPDQSSAQEQSEQKIEVLSSSEPAGSPEFSKTSKKSDSSL